MIIAPPRTMNDRSPSGLSGPKAPKKRPTRVPRQTTGLRGQINAWMAEAFGLMGAPELIGTIPWNMNKRMMRARGRASCTWNNGLATNIYMEFSVSLMKLSDEAGRRQCVFHECAHVVDYHRGTYKQGKSHGPSWQSLMIRAGLEPDRCHKVEPLKRRKMKKFKATCSCKEWSLSGQKRRKIKLGLASYSCKTCGQKLVLER